MTSGCEAVPKKISRGRPETTSHTHTHHRNPIPGRNSSPQNSPRAPHSNKQTTKTPPLTNTAAGGYECAVLATLLPSMLLPSLSSTLSVLWLPGGARASAARRRRTPLETAPGRLSPRSFSKRERGSVRGLD
jgi:hypothetical protein